MPPKQQCIRKALHASSSIFKDLQVFPSLVLTASVHRRVTNHLSNSTGGYAPSSNIVTLNTPDLSPMGVDAAASGARALYGSTCKQQPSAFNDYHVTCALTASSASVVSCLHVLHMRMWALGLG